MRLIPTKRIGVAEVLPKTIWPWGVWRRDINMPQAVLLAPFPLNIIARVGELLWYRCTRTWPKTLSAMERAKDEAFVAGVQHERKAIKRRVLQHIGDPCRKLGGVLSEAIDTDRDKDPKFRDEVDRLYEKSVADIMGRAHKD